MNLMRRCWLSALLLCMTAPGMSAEREPKVLDMAGAGASEVVILAIESRFKEEGFRGFMAGPERMMVARVDDREMKTFLTVASRFDQIRFLPGKHRVVFRVVGKGGLGYADLWFVAERGKSYQAHFETTRQLRFRAWIEDAQTGQPVGGITGSQDEPAGPYASSPASD